MNLTFKNLSALLFQDDKKVRKFFIMFYSIGALGVAIPFTRGLFIYLTPIALLMSFIAVIFYHRPEFNSKLILACIAIYLISFSVEAVGVHTGFIFGEYSYGKGLGIKVFGTPLMIGINWLLLVYCTSVIAERLPVLNILKIFVSSIIMVFYDLIMEQVAEQLQMWTFKEGIVPLRNYILWFIVALFLNSILKLTGIKILNKLAPLIFFCQLVFFIVLYLFFKIVE
jgi:putative membrane protein